MSIFSIKMNLLRFRNSRITVIKDKDALQRGIFIPISDNGIYVSEGDNGEAKSAYADFFAYENHRPTKYGYTYNIRQNLPRRILNTLSDSERESVTYIGGMRPYESKRQTDDDGHRRDIKKQPVHVYTANNKHSNSISIEDLPF